MINTKGRRTVRSATSRAAFKRLPIAGVALVLLALAAYWMVGRSNAAGSIARLETADFHSLAFSSDDPNVVFFGHHDGILRSDDGGRQWRPLVERRNFDAMSLAVHPTAATRLYLAGHDIYQTSTDGGTSWQPVAHNLPGTDIHAFAISPGDPNRIFAFVVGYGLFQSTDSGEFWTKVSDGAPQDVTAFAVLGGSPETILVGSARAGLVRSNDGGSTWLRSANGMSSPSVATLAVDPTSRQTVYAGGPGGLYKSMDGGLTWNRLVFPGTSVAALAVSPARPDLLLAISVSQREGLVYRSRNGGQTWDGS